MKEGEKLPHSSVGWFSKITKGTTLRLNVSITRKEDAEENVIGFSILHGCLRASLFLEVSPRFC